jgi:mono/diheme cytochrome c family protein
MRAAQLFILRGIAVLLGSILATNSQAAEPIADATLLQSFLKSHCVACHGPQKQEAKLRLDQLSSDLSDPAVARSWVEVMDQLNRGEMPPADRPRPNATEQQQVVRWIAAELRSAERRSRSSGGRVVLRRLNRTEYANTIRDLLKLTFLPGESPLDFLPPDGRADGFDKASSALLVDPSLLDKYYEVAQRIAEKAIVTGPPEFATYRNRFELEDTAKRLSIRYLCSQPGFHCREHDVVLMESGTRSFDDLFYPNYKDSAGRRKRIPIKGTYAVRVRASADRGGRGDPVTMQVVREGGGEGVLLDTVVDAPESAPKVYEVILPLGVDGGEFSVRLGKPTKFRGYSQAYGQMERLIEKAGNEQDFATIMRTRGRMLAEGIVSGSTPNPEVLDLAKVPKLIVDWIEIEGPLYEQWPPKSHELLLFKGNQATPDVNYAREIFTRFLPRAFRRPVTSAEVEPYVKLVDDELRLGTSFEESVRVGLAAVLTSPRFLYLFEPSSDERRELNDFELASRLSYFLWSSAPDDTLAQLAASGKLKDPRTLAAEVDRLLAHGNSRALVDGFGAQWLRTDEFRNFKPDEKLYKAYGERLGAAMVAQTLAFFEHVLRHKLPVTSFLDSDFTLVNERLAEFYGIAGVKGDAFQVVKLPADSPRGGLLGQAGVMLRGSDGNRTKPVSRGVYVREVLFNDPPDPPPPNVGEIEPNIQGKNLTVRERLLQHQQIEACAACHRSIDPYGLALENFNVIGQWRDTQDGENFQGRNRPTIDVRGTLPNGEAFETFAQFKSLLVKQHGRFRQALAEKLLSYALGRPVEGLDRPTIDRMTQAATSSDDSLRSMIQALVTSEAFRTK